MNPAVKPVVIAVTKSASTLLITFTGITIFLFASLRIYDYARVIQLNMEIALICAHVTLLFPNFGDSPIPMVSYKGKKVPLTLSLLVDRKYFLISHTFLYPWQLCRILSILTHFFFVATFMFMFLESLHTYSLVAFVVKKNGVLNRLQNTLVGWGFSVAIVSAACGLTFEDYGGEYHCWLQVNTNLIFTQLIPIVIIVVLTLTLLEASGVATYRRMPGKHTV